MAHSLIEFQTDQDRANRGDKDMSQKTDEAVQAASLPDGVAKELVQLFKLFADETRLRILHFLMQEDELNVRTLCELLEQSQPAVSHHLALLRVAGLIESRRDGKHNYYRILAGRFQELMEMLFSAEPNQKGRICFENFTISFAPVAERE